MEGKALICFPEVERSGVLVSWEASEKGLLTRFGPQAYDDPMECLVKLRQVGTVEEYMSQFELLANHLGDLNDAYKLSCYLSGLKDEIRLSIKTLNPTNLQRAYCLARMQEEYLMVGRKGLRTGSGAYSASPASGNVPSATTKPNVRVQKISPQQMKERRDKGLCYHCDSKWNPGHKCPNLKVFMVEGSEEFIESAAYEQGKEGQSLVEAVMEEETQDDNPNISLNAITGSVTSRTMRIKGRVSNQEVVILIDSGSTHNFC